MDGVDAVFAFLVSSSEGVVGVALIEVTAALLLLLLLLLVGVDGMRGNMPGGGPATTTDGLRSKPGGGPPLTTEALRSGGV
jgi:hypothetical protein